MPDETRSPVLLEELLRLEPAGDDAFTASFEGFHGVTFGGETLGCATLAAARTCEKSALHSLHVYFLRAVPGQETIDVRVERVRDGRRFAHRRVHMEHGGKLCLELLASFAAPSTGPEYQDASFDPATPPPESLPTAEEVAGAEGWDLWDGPLDFRWVGTPWRPESRDGASRYAVWAKPRPPLSEDRGLHQAAVAYLSDHHSHWGVARMLPGDHFEPVDFVSLDHVIWMHRDLPWTDWRLLTTESDVGHAGRALTRRTLHERDGRLVASIAQEAMIPGAAAS